MSGHRLRAPQQDRAIVAEPPLGAAHELVAGNLRRFTQSFTLLERPWQDLRQDARRSALDAARAYLRDAGEPVPAADGATLFVAGHQPELFHPGVWVKNFALLGMARRQRGVSLNLVVDNDTAKHTLLHVPVGDRLLAVPFDHWQGSVPFEERAVLDDKLFENLSERVGTLTESWPFEPLLRAFWPDVIAQGRRTALLGERLVAARRAWERRWGCTQLEVPLSRVCQTPPFAWFACHLLEELPRFHAIYNDTVHAYRRRHGLRSTSHPVPDLAVDGDWLEAPLWAWRAGQLRRERVFVRSLPDRLRLRLGKEEVSLPRPRDGVESAVAAWQALEGEGIKLRTRALTTTLFARMFLGDLFVHGIGGGKYDELTDEIIVRFYGLEAPAYMVLSATLLLPLPRFGTSDDDLRKLDRLERDLWWNPQRHLEDGAAKDLRAEKNRWIEQAESTHAERVRRFQAIRRITDQLRPFTTEEQQRVQHELAQTRAARAVDRVRSRRDFAFCLFPEKTLRDFLMPFATR